jgi:lysophospholipase L1-like esterase
VKNFLSHLFLVFFGIVTGLLILEVGIRVTLQDIVSRPNKYYRYHQVLGWEKIPNSSGKFKSSEYRFSVRYNAKGLRDQDYSYKKTPGIFRILLLGDSFVEGYGVEAEQIFGEVLEKKLNTNLRKYSQIQVINAGTGGYSTAQELLFFQKEGRKYQPDLVILSFYVDDTYNNAHQSSGIFGNPFFSLSDNKIKLHLPSLKKDTSASNRYLTQENSNPISYIKKWLRSHSALYILSVNLIFENFPRLKQPFIKLGLIGEGKVPPEFRLAFSREDEQEPWLITEGIIARLNEEVQKEKARLIILFIPNQIQVYPEDWERKKEFYGIKEADLDLRKSNKKLKDICMNLKIDFIDPTDIFRRQAQEGSRLYYKFDGHLNREGHALVAKLIYDYLLKKRLIPLSDT